MENGGLHQEPYVDGLAAVGTVRSYPKNVVLIHEGDRTDQLFVVLSGRLKVYLSDAAGKEVVIDTLRVNDCFGEMALEGEPRSASVMTLEPCRLSVIERDDFKRHLTTNPEIAYGLIMMLIRRARGLTRALGGLALLDVYGRVARLLLDNASQVDGNLLVQERMTQQEIAKRINSSREMVSRILTDLREGGYIGIEDDRIIILRTLPARW
ncbi:MAG: cyclic nucleotide-binding domain-containing protein [Burkholderiales bacterium]|nr:cyclic nucleotide-binding domain-containing protein [Burkholderiales bacterium]